MTSRHLVDPELAPLLDLLPSFGLNRADLPAIRAGLIEALAMPPLDEDDGVAVDERGISGAAGAPEVRIHLYRPQAQEGRLPAVLHLHAGGYVMGAPSIAEARNRWLAGAAGCAVASVQYRLAPENPFPAALDDAYTALTWLHREAGGLGLDAGRIAVAGESAGGGLAASLVQMAHDRGEVPVLMQLLTYPMLDDRSGRTIDRGAHAGEFVWTPESNRFAWDALLGEGRPADDPRPYAVPARREDLAPAPPAFIAVGALDLFAEEDIDYARRLVRAGVPTELHVYPGAFHGFDTAAGTWLAESVSGHFLAALRRAFHPAAAR